MDTVTVIEQPSRLKKGRRFSPEQRQELLRRFHQSGLSQREFVAREGLGLSTLSKWVRQAARPVPTKASALKFEELVLPSRGPGWALEIVSPHHWTLRFLTPPPPSQLQPLLQALPC